jgi:glutaminyl-peptide cyclotransferase
MVVGSNMHFILLILSLGKILQLTWREKKLFEYDLESFAELRQLSFATSNGEGWGITTSSDGKQHFITDGSSNLLVWDAVSLEETHRMVVKTPSGRPVQRLNELEWIRGEIWANIWYCLFLKWPCEP